MYTHSNIYVAPQTDRQTDRYKYTHAHTYAHTHTHTHTQRNTRKDSQTHTHTGTHRFMRGTGDREGGTEYMIKSVCELSTPGRPALLALVLEDGSGSGTVSWIHTTF